jgi:hypothetical protein
MPPTFDALNVVYEHFAADSAAYRADAACARGCAFCCTDAGRIDITTLEGLNIRRALEGLPRSRRLALEKALKQELKKREAGVAAPCPFLMKNHACMIYAVRPFACRRIYSLYPCSQAQPPRLSRQVMELAGQAIAALQRLDANGYTGHISYILHMLDAPRFLETYLAGDFKPEEIMAFGKTHGIVINRMVV